MEKEYKYMVCIVCMTYNQEDYIGDALDSFVHQQTNFPYCAVIIDDCSTDNTPNVIKEYEMQYPEIVKGVYLAENHYSQKKSKRQYAKHWYEQSKFFAVCEGDDYWINRHKLQIQVDYLNTHPECQLVFHNAILHSQDHLFKDRIMCSYDTGLFNLKQVFEHWQMPYASVMCRSSLLEHPVYKQLTLKVRGGWCFFIAAAKIGTVYGISDCMSVYRKNKGGVSKNMNVPFVIDANYKIAYATESEDAVKVIDGKVRQQLLNMYVPFLRGDKLARKAMIVARKYNKWLPYQLFCMFLIQLPKKIYRKCCSIGKGKK